MSEQSSECAYSDELAHQMLDRIADGESLAQICRKPGMPNFETFLDWLGRRSELREMYYMAVEDHAQDVLNECIKISRDRNTSSAEIRLRIAARYLLISKVDKE
jgi:hypothetical protein